MLNTAHEQYCPFESAGWTGYVRADSLDLLTGADPLAYCLERPHEKVKHRRTVRTVRSELPIGTAYVRHDAAPKTRWYRRARVFHTLKVHRMLAASGVAVPSVILAVRRGTRTGTGEELLVTEAVTGSKFKKLLHTAASDPDRGRLLALASAAVAALHQRGFVHGDLLPGNMLVAAPDGHIVFIDNERTRQITWPLFHHFRRRNLAQLAFRISQDCGQELLERFLDGYYTHYPLPARARLREQQAVLTRALARWRRRKVAASTHPSPAQNP
jgi:tRNA A-37 threonylcarbamoyl transferase component Bud32